MLALADFLITCIEADEDEAHLREVVSIADMFEQHNELPETRNAGSPFAPARVMIDCSVKLRMVQRARTAIERAEIVVDTFGGDTPTARIERALYLQTAATWSAVLRLMGLAYAHRPDYLEEWKL